MGESQTPNARDEDIAAIHEPVLPFLKAADHYEQHLGPPLPDRIDEGVPARQWRIAISHGRILGQRALARIDDDERTSAQFDRVKIPRPGLVAARCGQLRNVTTLRMERID